MPNDASGTGFQSVLAPLMNQFLQERRRVTGQDLAIFFSARAIADRQGLLRAGHRHIEQPPLFLQRSFPLGARMRQETVLQPGDVNVRELKTLATVHRNQGDDSPWRLLLFFAVAGERKVVEKIVQPFRRRQGAARSGVQLGHQTLQVLHAVFRSFGIFF